MVQKMDSIKSVIILPQLLWRLHMGVELWIMEHPPI